MAGGDFMQALQQMNDSGALQGLTNMGAGIAQGGAPGLGYKGFGAGLASGLAQFGPGMMQGAEQAYENQALQQQRAQGQAFMGAMGGQGDAGLSPQAAALRNMVPENMRPIMAALGPAEGSKMLAQLAMAQMDPHRSRVKLAPGETLFNELTGKPEFNNPFSPKESVIPTEAGTAQVGPDGQLRLVYPKPEEISAIGPYAYKRNFQTGQSDFITPPGQNAPNELDVVLQMEGSGKNPFSSSQGIGQFSNATAQEFLPKLAAMTGSPQLAAAAQSPDKGLGFFRMNPAVQRAAAQLYKSETDKIANEASGGQDTPADRYAAYMLRNDATPFLKAVRENPNAPVNQVLPPAVIQGNRAFFTNSDGSVATVGQAFNNIGNRYLRNQALAASKPNPLKFTPSDLVQTQTPEGPIYVPKENAAGLPGMGAQQTSVNVQGGASPSAQVTIGPNAPGGPSAATGGLPLGGNAASTPEKSEILNSIKELDNLQQARAQFNPEYFSTLGKLKFSALSAADRLSGGMLPKDQAQQLRNYTQAQQTIGTSAISRMHALFGARLTPPEMKRFGPTYPSENDSPTEYVAKLDQMRDMAQNAIMRDMWLSNQGMKLTDANRSQYDVTNMPKFVQEQAATYAKSLEAQSIPEQVVAQRTLEWIGQNFGITPPGMQATLRQLAGKT